MELAPLEAPEGRSSVQQSLSQGPNTDDEERRVEVAFWKSVQESNDPAEYLLYLQRFPEGQFAELAAARVEQGGSGELDPGIEVSFWETVRDTGNAEMIEAYLSKYPRGQFVDLANILLAEIRAKSNA
ncbi:hypothetical protein [Ensifer sp. 4252]|uniref:hypothetical protein n=1 Tax=Ensifer sp. 4252 TaxID=3373915 RepID=UPI003D1FFBE4